jgi:hypothetical protein
MKHFHTDIKQVVDSVRNRRLAQAPDQISFIGVKDTAQTLTFVLAEWHGCRFMTVLVLLAVWRLS